MDIELLDIAGENVKGTTTLENTSVTYYKVKQTPYDLAIPMLSTLSIDPGRVKTCSQKTCTKMFSAALFTITSTEKNANVH